MIPIATPDEVRAADAAATEPTSVLVARAGAAVARAALRLLGGAYGRRVTVVCGKGNNGADGREAARRLNQRGVRVRVVEATDAPDQIAPCDLVIDAAFGTGFRGVWDAPVVPDGVAVLAVDIPSGIDGLTGVASGRVMTATRTVTFAALKPGLVQGDGPAFVGDIEVADIGIDLRNVPSQLVTGEDVAAWYPRRAADAHKWRHAVWVVGGSPGMTGAAHLAAAAAARVGAGYVRLSTPGGQLIGTSGPLETVRTALAFDEWAREVRDGQARFSALVVGGGLGVSDGISREVRHVVAHAAIPTVVDGDGLTALGSDAGAFVGPTTILTPHDEEFARLSGARPTADRISDTRALAARLGCIVVLKGPTTVVADPDGAVRVVRSGDERLATAGTGDVLAGAVGGLLALGAAPLDAAAAAAFLCGRAGTLGWRHGLVAGDLLSLLPEAINSVTSTG